MEVTINETFKEKKGHHHIDPCRYDPAGYLYAVPIDLDVLLIVQIQRGDIWLYIPAAQGACVGHVYQGLAGRWPHLLYDILYQQLLDRDPDRAAYRVFQLTGGLWLCQVPIPLQKGTVYADDLHIDAPKLRADYSALSALSEIGVAEHIPAFYHAGSICVQCVLHLYDDPVLSRTTTSAR